MTEEREQQGKKKTEAGGDLGDQRTSTHAQTPARCPCQVCPPFALSKAIAHLPHHFRFLSVGEVKVESGDQLIASVHSLSPFPVAFAVAQGSTIAIARGRAF